MKNESIFKVMLNTVSKLPWLKGTVSPSSKNMKPGKGFNQPVPDHAFDYLKELDDSEFDKLISMLFKQRGYSVSAKEQNNNDSVDVVLKMNSETTFVQYKHWREYQVDVAVIEEFYAVMESESIPHGIVITTGLFTQDALDYSHGKHLLLINGVDLSQMIGVLSASNDDSANDEAQIDDEQIDDEQIDNLIDEMPELEPLCPICSREMIKRTAKKGKNAGNTFWGCSQFPNCLGVVSN